MKKQILKLTPKMVRNLELPLIPGSPIIIGSANIHHIQERHPRDYRKYFKSMRSILKNPDLVKPREDGSLQFIRIINGEEVIVVVRPTKKGVLFVRTMYSNKRRVAETISRNPSFYIGIFFVVENAKERIINNFQCVLL
ncbi:PBECR2 nuclease fold domain-containing protein [Paenibacillus agilis]|uniref:Phage-Barnase-EndoU-ColicinE5/D-RelE like nuclease 3 domain-containing protein n=1 Tax=Paenibacillus agilis TaxID=3020863 RepID=A0A559ID01_9BACL|nr:PBECR2 nuclease fold domain-containing protein [Paenibacillus agilis]TVX85552.1 hypothetical protein FPZ44_24660 [Paenibacillus agilis]